MAIQWYPGHMHKAQKEMKEIIHKVDLIIEVIDARIPYSSSNPVIAGFSDYRGLSRPMIKVMTKVDLADPLLTQQWCQHFDRQNDMKALPVNALHAGEVKNITQLARSLAPARTSKGEHVRAMVMGIPNVGKSTIINGLTGRKIAKVGNEPAVTKHQQRIVLPEGVILFDTPGILWPKIENDHSSYRLAVSGAIKDTAMDHDEVAFYLIDYLVEHYPEELKKKYQLDKLYPETIDTIEAIGRFRKCLRSRGSIDLDKVSKIIIHDYRTASLGRITLETPSMIEKELLVVDEKIRLREEKKAARKSRFNKNK